MKIFENNVYFYEFYEKFLLERIVSILFYERYLFWYLENFDYEIWMRYIFYINENCFFKKGSDLMKRFIKDFLFVKNVKIKWL